MKICKKTLKHEEKEEFWASLNGFFLLAVLVLIIWLANFFLMPYFFKTNAGTAGDMFGGITALFSGLAFAGLVTTLFMQRKELELQRKELRQTRKVFSTQQFESTFFGLLRLLNEHVQSISKVSRSGSGQTIEGRRALVQMAEKLPVFNEVISAPNLMSKDGEQRQYNLPEVLEKYEKLYEEDFEPDLGPYFRLIYNILRHIESTRFDEKGDEDNEKKKLIYSKILRAHLNSSEVLLLMFNCASIHGRGLKPWLEKHSLLKHITRKAYEANKLLVEEYDPLAFRFDERKTNEVSN